MSASESPHASNVSETEALLMQEPGNNANMKPVYSSDSLMALAAQGSLSGLGSPGAALNYPVVPPPASVLSNVGGMQRAFSEGSALDMPPTLFAWPPPPDAPPSRVASAPSMASLTRWKTKPTCGGNMMRVT